jgi:hypothetical protein
MRQTATPLDICRKQVRKLLDNYRVTRVRGHEADGRNLGHFSMTCDGLIRGVCLSRGGCLGRLFDREDLLRH